MRGDDVMQIKRELETNQNSNESPTEENYYYKKKAKIIILSSNLFHLNLPQLVSLYP